MKICPQCEAGYPDELTTCPVHGGLLSEIRDLKPGMLVRGTYRIVRKLSQGGMGNVYLAQHILLNEFQVLKFLPSGQSRDKEATDRFVREVRTLRQIHHPNVVTAGNLEPAEDGTLFFSMEYVDGPNLMELYRHAPKPFDVAVALTIVRGAAEGLGAAHAVGVVHRDIKPENILIAHAHDRLIPKLADFGIVATQDVTRLTQAGATMLTPQFAAPEQWVGTPTGELDGRTDLYALGGVLFEILTGRCAFEASKFQDWATQHLYTVPVKPSTFRKELAHWRGLDELVLHLLAKDVHDRPQNVGEMLRLLKRIEYLPLQREPILPVHALPEELLPAEVPRPLRADLAELAPFPAEPAAELAPVAAQPVEDAKAQPTQRRVKTEPMPIWEPMQPRSAERPRAILEDEEKEDAAPASRSYIQVVLAAIVIVAAIALGVETLVLNPVRSRVLAGQHDAIVAVAFSPNGLNVGSASRDGTVQIWNVSDGRPLGEMETQTDALAYSPAGHTVATGTGNNDIDLWDDTRSVVLETLQGDTAQVSALAFTPDGHTLAAGSWDQTVRLWNVSSGQLLRTLNGSAGRIFSVAFSPDGRTLASAGADQTIRLWDTATGTGLRELKGQAGAVRSVAFAPNGTLLVSAGDDGAIRVWNVATGRLTRVLHGHGGAIYSVSISPDGRTLASGDHAGIVQLWSMQSGGVLRTLKGHEAPVLSVAFSPFGTVLASGSADSTVRLWKIADVVNSGR